MSEERRANPNPFDIAGLLAILYTIGYIGMVGMLYFVAIPQPNKEPLLQLFGLMSAIQMALIGFYFGGSKQVEATQRATEQRQGRTDAVVQQVIEKLPLPSAQPVVTPASENPATGNTPAAETATPNERKDP